jgi:hypothetical protein
MDLPKKITSSVIGLLHTRTHTYVYVFVATLTSRSTRKPANRYMHVLQNADWEMN